MIDKLYRWIDELIDDVKVMFCDSKDYSFHDFLAIAYYYQVSEVNNLGNNKIEVVLKDNTRLIVPLKYLKQLIAEEPMEFEIDEELIPELEQVDGVDVNVR